MYLYSFSKFSWPDRIFIRDPWKEFSRKIKSGDLLRFGEDVFICFGNEISFSELYSYPYQTTSKPEILYRKLLSKTTVQLIHWMVYQNYSLYRSVMRYFISHEWETLLKKEVKTWKSKNILPDIKFTTPTHTWQTLIVFPDLWTIHNMVDEKIFEAPWVSFLYSKQTQTQKDKHRRAIKMWNSNLIFASPSEIFQDFKDLKKIVLIDPHKWYYANQQDPRYKVGAVLEEMKSLYNVELEILWL